MGRRRWSAAVLALTLAGGVGACSNRQASSNKQPHSGTATATSAADGLQTVVITSGVDLRFHPSTIVVHPGRVRLVLENTARPNNGPPHDLQFGGLPFYIGTVQAGSQASVTFTAPAPGTYAFVCTIHANQNQTGKLIVR